MKFIHMGVHPQLTTGVIDIDVDIAVVVVILLGEEKINLLCAHFASCTLHNMPT